MMATDNHCFLPIGNSDYRACGGAMELDDETVARFFAAIVRTAIRDHTHGWHEPPYPDATAFLAATGLLQPDGTIARVPRT